MAVIMRDRAWKFGNNTANMTKAEINLLTGTDIKRLRGSFEMNMQFWVR